jgi:hypothetical protein
MPTYDDVLRAARALPPAERQRLARELADPAATPARAAELPIATLSAPRPHSVAWVKAERGHAVLATDTPESDADIPAGADAIAGMWADRVAPAEGT